MTFNLSNIFIFRFLKILDSRSNFHSLLAISLNGIKIKDESRSFYHELHSACLVKKASYTACYHLFFYANVISKFLFKKKQFDSEETKADPSFLKE